MTKKNRRKKHIYYTPQHIIDYIEGKRIANPSAGSGAFLKEAADQLTQWILKNPPFGKSK